MGESLFHIRVAYPREKCTDPLRSGQDFPVHPLDITYPEVTELNGQNATACVNTYQYLTLDPNSFQGFDMILGDAFLRNVYTSYVSSHFWFHPPSSGR